MNVVLARLWNNEYDPMKAAPRQQVMKHGSALIMGAVGVVGMKCSIHCMHVIIVCMVSRCSGVPHLIRMEREKVCTERRVAVRKHDERTGDRNSVEHT